MAEFQEVMRQWVRARKATKCRGEENNMLSVYPLEAYDDTLIANIEERVMAWVAEHPVVYPTWVEWLVDSGVFPQKMSTIPSIAFNTIRDSLSVEIPADIAQKLGIKPKEG